MEDFCSTKQVAKALSVNVMTVKRWIHKGVLPGYKLDKEYRIKKSDIDKFLSERLVKK